MSVLKSRKAAVIIVIIVAILCTFLGSHRSLAAERRKAEKLLLEGAGSGYSVTTDLRDARDVAANLYTVGSKYLPTAVAGADIPAMAELSAALTAADSALSKGDSRAYREAKEGLEKAAGKALEALRGAEVSEKDAGYLRGFEASLKGCFDRMERDPYNAAAKAFNDLKAQFPANVLGGLTGVKDLDYFK